MRQQGFDREQQALVAASQGRYENYGAKQEANAETLGDFITGQSRAEVDPAATGIIPGSDSNVTVLEEARQKQKARGETDKNAVRLGDVLSFGETLGDTLRLQGRDASQIGQIGSFRRGSQNVLPYELDAASHAGDKAAFGADILRGLGSVASMYGLTAGGTSPQVRLGQRIMAMKPPAGIVRLGTTWAGG